MGRLGLMVIVLVLAGCSALRDAFSAHAQVAGTAAGQTLTVDRLAHVVGHAQRIPIRPDVLTGVANAYLDYAVFATELGRGRDLHDSALVLAAEWPVAAQLKWERYHERLIVTRGKLTPAQADSAFQAGTVRLFQHILIRIPQSAVSTVEQEKEKQVTALLRRAAAQRGFNFAQLARRYSEDPGTKTRGGYLPATPRGQFVPAFDSAAWTLPPGAMTAVVRTPFGFHIIRRPPLAEVRDSFRADLENSRTAQFDSLYLDSLAKQRQLKIGSGAPALVRQAVPQIVSARRDTRPLATYRGGTFQVKDLARVQLAMAHVDRYVDQAVTQGSTPFFPVPPFLASALRQGQPWSLNEAGIARAVESAQAIRAADTTAHGAPPTGLKRAPGPPPVAAESGGRQAPH